MEEIRLIQEELRQLTHDFQEDIPDIVGSMKNLRG